MNAVKGAVANIYWEWNRSDAHSGWAVPPLTVPRRGARMRRWRCGKRVRARAHDSQYAQEAPTPP
jgi:hypothetical protein